jgi:D-alanine-D-alanine ligase
MSTVLVLSGGGQSEHDVSLRSGIAVSEALHAKGHTVLNADPAKGFTVTKDIDAVFPALHGLGGEDGSLQTQLEKLGAAYVGSDSQVSALCFDKWQYRKAMTAEGIDMAKAELVTRETIWQSPLVSQPFVLKPFDGGSSLDTYIIRDVDTLDKAKLTASFDRHDRMLLEELITGVEITVGVLDTEVLPAVEIIPPDDGEFDYENKYNGMTQELCPPVHLDEATHQRARELAVHIHTLLGCRDLSRTDMIITAEGRIVVLETNTLPGMTGESLFPKAAAAYGLAFPELCDRLVKLALSRK